MFDAGNNDHLEENLALRHSPSREGSTCVQLWEIDVGLALTLLLNEEARCLIKTKKIKLFLNDIAYVYRRQMVND